MYKLVIPSAGIGSRIGPYTKFMNKALVSIGNIPTITRIIKNFPDAQEIIILLGYKGDYVRQVVSAFFPNLNIRFIDVDNFNGPGSGLGYTLSKAKEHLQCPFIFTSNDTVIVNDKCNINPSIYGNWMGWSSASNENSQYRTLNIVNKDNNYYVASINPKGVNNANKAYIGLAGIKDYKEFWNAMSHESAIGMGESYGMQALKNIRAIEFPSWCDIGNIDSLEKTKKLLSNNEFNILEKENEAIWFNDGNVIKFSTDENFIADRIKRLNVLDKDLFPNIISHSKNLYVYRMVKGDVLSKKINIPLMNCILDTISERMWIGKKAKITPDLISACYDFYKKKTYERVDMFHKKYEIMDKGGYINNEYIPSVVELLDNLNWELICENPHASAFHGDFHNENIIIDEKNNPILIDWRQNFGKNIFETGDAYYDFAKFNHGLIVSHHIVNNNNFTVEQDENNVNIDILRPSILVEAEEDFYEWLKANNFDVKRVKIMTALIYLNIAALHEYPYSLYLYYLGRQLLYKWGKNNEYSNW
jgi:choline kinase